MLSDLLCFGALIVNDNCFRVVECLNRSGTTSATATTGTLLGLRSLLDVLLSFRTHVVYEVLTGVSRIRLAAFAAFTVSS